MATNFTNPPTGRSDLLQMMYRLAQNEPLGHVRFLPFILREDIKRFLSRLNVGRFRSNVVVFDEYYLLRLQRIRLELDAREEAPSGDFALWQISDAVWCFCSIESPTVVINTAMLSGRQHPSRASLIYVSTREFQRIFEKLSGDYHRVMVLQHSEYNRQESNVNYLKETKDFKTVFSELALKDAVVRRIVVKVYSRANELVATFSFNNDGLLALRDGSITFLLDRVVNEVARIGNTRNVLFQNRERRHLDLHPLELSFESEILADKTANEALIDSISSISKSAIAVFHANPYIHILYTDFRDGSSFNIYSSSDSALTIVPSTRASVSALMRLYRGISEKFADCDISEVAKLAPTAGEFFGE
jgi:hypothetical protein